MQSRVRWVVLSVLLGACSGAGADTAPAVDDAVPVRVTDVVEATAAPAIEAPGVLAPSEEVRLSFKIGGVVARVLVEEGARVRAGDVLAALDTREIDAQVTKARSALEKAERDYARVRNLHRDSVATLEQLENAATAVEVARSDYDAAIFNQRYATIRAPGSGVVMRKSAEPGELVGAGQPVLTFGNDGAGTVVQVALADRDAARVKVGDAAEVVFDALPGQTFAGRVSRTSGAADAVTGTYGIEISLAGGPRNLNGLIGRVRIQPTAANRVRLVPIEAVHDANGSAAVVYTLGADGTTAERVDVRLGFIDGDRIAILQGLDEVSRVITSGSAYLTHGTRVKVVP